MIPVYIIPFYNVFLWDIVYFHSSDCFVFFLLILMKNNGDPLHLHRYLVLSVWISICICCKIWEVMMKCYIILFICLNCFSAEVNGEIEGENAQKDCRNILIVSIKSSYFWETNIMYRTYTFVYIYTFFPVGTMDAWTEHKVKNVYGYLGNLEAIWYESLTVGPDLMSFPTLDALEYHISSRLYVLLNCSPYIRKGKLKSWNWLYMLVVLYGRVHYQVVISQYFGQGVIGLYLFLAYCSEVSFI